MKFTWFNLMPWPHLPVDFRERHRSVWVDIPSSLYDPEKGHEVYNSYLDQLEYAESLGFDGTETFDVVGLNESLQPQSELTLRVTKNGESQNISVLCRIDTPIEVDYYRHGGILPYVLRQLAG